MTSVGYLSTWEAHSSCTSDRRTTILPQVTLPMAFVNITSPLFTRPQLDDDEIEQREYMMAKIKGTEDDVTDRRTKNIKYVTLRFKGLPAHVAKNFNLPAHYEYPPPPYYKKLEQYIHLDEADSLPFQFKDPDNRMVTYTKLTKPFFISFEMPLDLFKEILAYYCTVFEVKWKKGRKISLYEYAELCGLIFAAMKSDPFFEKNRLNHDGYSAIHKKFVKLFTDWDKMFNYIGIIQRLEDDEHWLNDTDDYDDIWDDWWDEEGNHYRSPRVTKEEDEGDLSGKEDV